jgi:hypothetical protein
VLWSYALAYRDVSLAPRDQLAQLERIGELVDGEGPTLITEYSPYGARHFLRAGDPESISELRRREISLRDGSQVPKGESADTDRIDPAALAVYRSLVVRRSPTQSRPPLAYERTWAGDHYELWQRDTQSLAAPARLALGDSTDPTAVPPCEDVQGLAASAEGAALVAAQRAAPVVRPLSRAGGTEGTIRMPVALERSGEYELWLGGSVRPSAEARIDGSPIGEVRHELNNDGGFISFGSARLDAGPHTVEVELHEADLSPGSDGQADPVGPLVLSSSQAADAKLIRVSPEDAARRLCGRAWDWIEVADS